jgi:hypothetical protein
MTKRQAFGSQVDLKKFFEASVKAINGADSQRAPNHGVGISSKKAVADAAKALAALWKLETSPRTR